MRLGCESMHASRDVMTQVEIEKRPGEWDKIYRGRIDVGDLLERDEVADQGGLCGRRWGMNASADC